MKLIPNPYDVRIRNKFKPVLNITDKDIQAYLKGLEETPQDQYDVVTPDQIDVTPSTQPSEDDTSES